MPLLPQQKWHLEVRGLELLWVLIWYIHQFKDLSQQHTGKSILLVQIIDVMVVMELLQLWSSHYVYIKALKEEQLIIHA